MFIRLSFQKSLIFFERGILLMKKLFIFITLLTFTFILAIKPVYALDVVSKWDYSDYTWSFVEYNEIKDGPETYSGMYQYVIKSNFVYLDDIKYLTIDLPLVYELDFNTYNTGFERDGVFFYSDISSSSSSYIQYFNDDFSTGSLFSVYDLSLYTNIEYYNIYLTFYIGSLEPTYSEQQDFIYSMNSFWNDTSNDDYKVYSMGFTSGLLLDSSIVYDIYNQGYNDGDILGQNTGYRSGLEDMYDNGSFIYGFDNTSSYDYLTGENSAVGDDIRVGLVGFMPSLLGSALGFIFTLGSLEFLGISVNSVLAFLGILLGILLTLKLIFGGGD